MTSVAQRVRSFPPLDARTAPRPRRARAVVAGSILTLVLLATLGATVGMGQAAIPPGEVISILWSHLIGADAADPLRDAIVWQGRLPRVLTAAAVGGGLALCGAAIQALTRNPLADPYLLGLSSGASTGAVVVIVLGAGVILPVAAFAGAVLALALTLGLARGSRSTGTTGVVLAGLAVSAVLSALTSLVIFWSATGDSYREILSWLLGSLANSSWDDVALTASALTVLSLPVILRARSLDSLSLGDTAATALGVNVKWLRSSLLVSTALLTGALVAASGAIGFVGLILPHAVRALGISRHAHLLPLTALSGAIFLVWADTIARTVFDPRELPVGVVTALVGGPLFAWLLIRPRGARL